MPETRILQALADAAILTDPNGLVKVWNAAATKLFGWTAGEMVGRPLIERFPEAARPAVAEQLQQLAAGGGWDGEFEDYRKDGSRIWIEAHVHPVRDQSGSITGILGVSREISPERAAAIERERHDEYVCDILDSVSAQVAVLDQDGRIREVNHAWKRFGVANTPAGCTPCSTDIGINYVGLCRRSTGEESESAVPAADGIEEVLQGKRSYFVMEYPCEMPTEKRWFAMHVTPLSTSGGGAVVAHYDITALKQAELAVAAHGRRTEMALNAAHMGLWTLDLNTRRIEWSPDVYKIIGVPDFDGTEEAWLGLIHPDDLPAMQSQFNEAIERRMPFAGEFRIFRPGGEIGWLANVAQVECDASGEVVAVVGTVQDITARKRSEWALSAYNQILELIAAGADLHKILDQVVRLIEEQLPGSLCSILTVDKAGCLRCGASRSLPDDYSRAIDGVAIGPKAGSCGTAAFRKETVTVTDIATDPLWEDYRELALQHGLKSCVSVPILSSGNVPGNQKGEVIGTFALYNRKPGDFDRLTYAILTGAEQLVRRAVQAERGVDSVAENESAHVIEAAHLAGMAIERDHAGNAIRESEERFRAIFDSAPYAIYIKELDGRHLYVNQATATIFGVPQADWIGKRSRELLPDHLADICERSDQTALLAEQQVEERITSQLPDGREATVMATHTLLRHADGTPYAICGILRDITELVFAQQEFERLWLHAPDPLCVFGFDGYLKQVNPAWSRLLGWSEAELLARPWTEIIHPDDLHKAIEATGELAAGRTVHRLVNRYRCKEGKYRWFSWDAIPSPVGQSVYGFGRDVTEEKRLAEQFHHAQKMEAIGQLASGVAHDFNNLLTIITGYSELLLNGAAASEQDALTQVLEAGHRAAELTSQLLSFSRKAIVEPKNLDINQIVDSSARMLRRLIGENVQLETSLAAIPLVKFDAGQLEQVFMNLAVNARDAMPDGGRLSITTDVFELADGLVTVLGPGPCVRVSVADTGQGIPPEAKGRIFEPFFTTKGPGKGTGLGLATVYGIVQQAGGAILVESELGVGTTFQILLPAVNEKQTNPHTAGIPVPLRGNETILIAEDEDGVLNIARLILETQGYNVLASKSGTAAVQVATEYPGPIHLLLTDVIMPDFGGRELAQLIRNQRPEVRIIYMSGYTDDAVVRSGVESSQEWLIQKPFTPLMLAKRVRDSLDKDPCHQQELVG